MNIYKYIYIFFTIIFSTCQTSIAMPSIYISPEVPKQTSNSYINTQNLYNWRLSSLISWSHVQTYDFGAWPNISYKWVTWLDFASWVVEVSLRDMTWWSVFGSTSTAPQNIRSFNSNAIEWLWMQDYSPYPLFLSWTMFWNEQWGRDDSKNALLFEFPSNAVWFGARFGDIESSSLWTLAELRLFDELQNVITWSYLTNSYSETTCWWTNLQNSISLCGNEATRYIWRHDDHTWSVRYMLLIVWDDDPSGNIQNQDYSGWTEHLSFIWPTLATIDYIAPTPVSFTWTNNIQIIPSTWYIYSWDILTFDIFYHWTGSESTTWDIIIYLDTGLLDIVSSAAGVIANHTLTISNIYMQPWFTWSFQISAHYTQNQTWTIYITWSISNSWIQNTTNAYINTLYNYIYSWDILTWIALTGTTNTWSENTWFINTWTSNTGEISTWTTNTGDIFTWDTSTWSSNTWLIDNSSWSIVTGDTNTWSNTEENIYTWDILTWEASTWFANTWIINTGEGWIWIIQSWNIYTWSQNTGSNSWYIPNQPATANTNQNYNYGWVYTQNPTYKSSNNSNQDNNLQRLPQELLPVWPSPNQTQIIQLSDNIIPEEIIINKEYIYFVALPNTWVNR